MDDAVLQQCRNGDPDAFRALFDSYHTLVYRTAYLLLRDPAQAEDALQEIFLKVYRSLDRYDPDRAAFSTWLYRMTVNYCLNARRRVPFVLPLGRVPLGLLGHSPGPDERPADDDGVLRAVRGLSDKLRVVVVLRFYADLSHEEIARVLDLPVGTVKSRLSAALRTLRVRLAPMHGRDGEVAAGHPREQEAL